jgi:hypothetical protein
VRKALAVLFLIAGVGLVAGAAPVSAEDTPSAKCGGAPVATGVDGAESAAVCVGGVGAVTGAQKDQGGYLAVDGDNDNALTAVSQCLDGHLALQVVDGSAGVAADDGEVTDPDGVTTDESYNYPQGEGDPIDPSVC